MFCLNSFGKLANYGKLGAAADPDAVIKALFANSEQGAWYAPRDLTTMFQDRAGTTLVTADGQAVGMILDKSKGLVLGSELVTNGTFDSNVAGWTPTDISIESVSGICEITPTSTSRGWMEQTVATEIGKVYRLSITKKNGEDWFHLLLNGAEVFAGMAAGTYAGFYRAVSSSTVIRVKSDASLSSFSVLKVDDIQFYALDGNHATAPSDAARPLKTSTGLSDWINYDAVDDVLNSTFPSSLGSSCTVCRANVGAAPTILTAQTIGTSYADSTDHAGLIIINRALTGQETTDVTAWLTAKGATA